MSNESRLQRYFLLDMALGVVLPILATFLLLYRIILPKGMLFYGDVTYYYVGTKSFYANFFNRSFAWTSARGTGPPLTMFSHSIPLTLLAFLFGGEIGVKAYILIVATLPGTATYFALKILAKEWALFKDGGVARLFASVGALFMLLPFVNYGLLDAGNAVTWSHATLPLCFALFVRYVRKGSLKDLLLLSLISIFAIANPFWIYLIIIMGLLYFVTEITISHQKLSLAKRSIVATLFILAVNAFWLIPTIAGYVLGAGSFFQSYTVEKRISFEGLRFLSHWTLLDVIMAGEHERHFFWHHPKNYGPLNVTIPISAVASILTFRRSRYVPFMGLILVMGIFLTKGVWEPAGYLYYLVAKSLPYGAGGILRNPCKFVPLVTFSYAFLVGLFVAHSYNKLKQKSNIVKSHHTSLNRLIKTVCKLRPHYLVTLLLTISVLAPITYGTLLDLQGYTWQRYKPTYVPGVYDKINEWLLQQPGDFNVMWIPSGGAYVWKPYIITAFPDMLSSRPAVSFGKVYPEPWKSTDRIGEILAVLGVKYVVYHSDSIHYPNEEIIQDILRQKDLKPVYRLNYTYVSDDSESLTPKEMVFPFIIFKNEVYRGLVYTSNLALTYGSDIPTSLSQDTYTQDLAALFNAEEFNVKGYEQVSPVEWHGAIDAPAPFILVFTEPYDHLWRVYVNGKEIEPINLYGLVNAFYIEDSGSLYVKIYYKLQDYYNLGYFMSLITIVIVVAYNIFNELKFRARLKGNL